MPSWDGCDFLDLWFTGMAGARIYAKYLRPHSDKPVPLVLQFHGYPGASRSFAGMGMALIAMDCPGQAGYSVDAGGFLGTTVSGHIVAGLDGPAEGMYYVRLHQNIRILCRIVRQLQEIDSKNFAPLVQCPVLFGTGLEDVICPPQTQCAVYNNLHCKKKRYLFPGYGHEEIAEFDDMLLDFFCKEEAVL